MQAQRYRAARGSPMTDTIRITHFAGLPVPEEGLVIHPPQGGTLNVRPHGEFEYTPPEAGLETGGEGAVVTYYTYVIEDIDGATYSNTFALDPVAENALAEDFQAWSLPGILEAGEEAASLFEGTDAAADHDMTAHDAAAAHGHHELVSGDMDFDDDVTLMIINSHNV